jgi:hypothetical protein
MAIWTFLARVMSWIWWWLSGLWPRQPFLRADPREEGVVLVFSHPMRFVALDAAAAVALANELLQAAHTIDSEAAEQAETAILEQLETPTTRH